MSERELNDMIRDSVRELSAEYDRDYWWTHVDEKSFPQEYWGDLADAGWPGVCIPEEHDGEGLGMEEMTIVIEEPTRGG